MIKNKQYTLVNRHGAKTPVIYISTKNNIHTFKSMNGAKVRLSDEDLKNLKIQ